MTKSEIDKTVLTVTTLDIVYILVCMLVNLDLFSLLFVQQINNSNTHQKKNKGTKSCNRGFDHVLENGFFSFLTSVATTLCSLCVLCVNFFDVFMRVTQRP